jgi:hypothetical protein
MTTTAKPFLRSRASKILFIGAISLIAILLVIVAFPGILPAGWLKNRLEPILGRALSCTVRIQSARMTSFFPLTIRVSDIAIEKSRPDAPVTGRLESATFGISLLDLARKRPYFSRIEIDGGALDIVGTELPPAKTSAATENGYHPPVVTALATLSAQEPTAAPTAPLVIESLSVSRGTITLNTSSRPEPLVFSDFSGEGGVADRRLTCRMLRTTVASGVFTGDGEANFGRDATMFTLRGTLADVDFARLFARTDGTFISGTGRLKMDLRGTWSGGGGGFEQMEGNGETEIRDGGFPKIAFSPTALPTPRIPAVPEVPDRIGGIDTGPVKDLIGGILPSTGGTDGKSAPATPTSPNAPPGESVRFQSLTLKFRFDTGRLNLSDLICTLDPDHRATADGTVFYRENPARISFQVKIPAGYFIRKRAISLPFIGSLGPESLSNVLIPVSVEGSVAKPVVHVGNLPVPL